MPQIAVKTDTNLLRRTVSALRRRVENKLPNLQHRFKRPNLYRITTRERIGVVYDAPSEMTVTERLFLYTLIRGTRPERVLEIGSRHGGSASIMAAAMEDIGRGMIVGVDPQPKITVPAWKFFDRFDLVQKPSPDGLADAHTIAGGKFDFALIDGLHIYDQARKDLRGVLPYMNPGAHILLHDAFHFGMSEAIRQTLEESSSLQDCGYVCAKPAVKVGMLAYGGFRMLRVGEEHIVDPEPILNRAYTALGKAPPPRDPELVNHDPWYCRTIRPCAYCQRKNADKLRGDVVPDLSSVTA